MNKKAQTVKTLLWIVIALLVILIVLFIVGKIAIR
jgi:hypothetical protein